MKKLFFAFVLCVLMSGCVTISTLRLDPQPLTGQKKVSQEGVSAVVSEKKVTVTVRPSTDTYSSEDRPRLVVGVYSTEGSFTFSTNNIQVFVDGNPHRVFTYDELVADVMHQEKIAKDKAEKLKEAQYMTGGSGGGLSTDNANKQYTTSLYKAEKDARDALKDLNDTALRDLRVLPGKQYTGYVTIEKITNPSQSHEIKVIVTADGEKHEFLLNQVEVKK
jgi:hypothetical protein